MNDVADGLLLDVREVSIIDLEFTDTNCPQQGAGADSLSNPECNFNSFNSSISLTECHFNPKKPATNV